MSFTNALLAQKISDLIDYWSSFNEEYSDWLGGTVDGGPGADGKYPLTNWAGAESLIDSPAKLADNVSGYVGLASASETAAAASAAAAATSESNASTSASTATAQAVLADADRVAAELAEANALSSQTVATAQANLATDRVGYASEWANAAFETLVSAAAGGDLVDDYSALHWATVAEGFAGSVDSGLYGQLAQAETVTGNWTFSGQINPTATRHDFGPTTADIPTGFLDNADSALVTITNASAAYSGDYGIHFTRNVDGNVGWSMWRDTSAGDLVINHEWNSTDADIVFRRYTTDLMRLEGDGVVGIPGTLGVGGAGHLSYPLQVYTTIDGATPTFRIQDSNGRVFIGGTSGGAAVNIGGTGDIEMTGNVNRVSGLKTLQAGSSGADAITITTDNLRIGGDVGAGRCNILGTANTLPALAIQEGQADQTLIAFEDTAGTGGLGFNFDGFVVNDNLNGIARLAVFHFMQPGGLDGDGSGINFRAENVSGTPRDIAYFDAYYDDISADSVTMKWYIRPGSADANPASVMTLDKAGNLAATGAVTGSNLNVANWDTAYGWGDHAGLYEPADATILKDADIGVTVAAFAHNHAGVYEPADATILKDADIGVTVEPALTNTLTLESSAGDASLYLKADTSNTVESSNPFIRMEQDGNAVATIIGSSGADGVDAEGNVMLNAGNNGFNIHMTYTSGTIGLGVGGDTAMRVAATNDVTFYKDISVIGSVNSDLVLGNNSLTADNISGSVGAAPIQIGNGTGSPMVWGQYCSLGRTYSAARTGLANNAYVDSDDSVSGQWRHLVTHGSYGHTILEIAGGAFYFYGNSNSVTAGNIVAKNQRAQLDQNGFKVAGSNVNPGAAWSSLSSDMLHLDGKEVIDGNDTWLRINQNGDFSNGCYLPNPWSFANVMKRYNKGAYLFHQSSSYAGSGVGGITFSTSAASGGSSGDIWFQYT